MRESEPLYFADIMIAAGGAQCEWCGEWVAEDSLTELQADAPRNWVKVCEDCKARSA